MGDDDSDEEMPGLEAVPKDSDPTEMKVEEIKEEDKEGDKEEVKASDST